MNKFSCGHNKTPENTIKNISKGKIYERCRICKNRANVRYMRKVRQR